MISVLVAHDQSLHRYALRMVLDAEPGVTVVGEASGGAQAVRLSGTVRPDVVLVAGQLLGPDGIDALRHGSSAPRVLVMSPAGSERSEYALLRAGADGFLLEDASPEELVTALHVVAAGDAVTTPRLTRALIDTVRQLRAAPVVAEPPVGLDAFTRRERDVLVALASGWSNAEIAGRLSIAPTTVKSHVSNILAKIGARARVQAVSFAYESGLIRPAA